MMNNNKGKEMKSIYKKLAIAVTLVVANNSANAGWIQSLGMSETCVAVGGACVAKEGDYAAFYHNPAAASVFKTKTMGGNLRVIDTTYVTLEDSGGTHSVDATNIEGDVAIAPALSYYQPINENLTLGFGIGAPFAITADWENDEGIHRYNMSEQSLFVIEISPTLSYKVNEKLSLGLSVNVVALKQLRTESLIPLSFGAALPPALGGAGAITPTTADSPIIGSITTSTDGAVGLGIPPDEFETSFDEYSFTLGMQYQVNDRLRLGAVYRSQTDMSFSGDLTLDLNPAGLGQQTVGYELDFDMPGHVQLGVEYQLIPNKLAWSFDTQWTQWASADGIGSTAKFKFDAPLLGFINDLDVDYEANNTMTFRTGIEYAINEHLSVMAGYAYDESIFDDQYVDILTYDSDRNIFSLGMTYDTRAGSHSGGWAWTASVQMTDYKKRNIEAGESQNLGGFSLPNLLDADTLSFSTNRDSFEYGGAIWAFGVSVQYYFGQE